MVRKTSQRNADNFSRSICFPDKAKDEMQLLKSSDDKLYRAKFLIKTVETYKSILKDLERDIIEAKT